MKTAALIALSLLVAAPAATRATAQADPAAGNGQTTVSVGGDDPNAIPPGAPTDDYGFVAWCYGAMDESIIVYEQVLPELKAIDARIGSPVKEAVPYADDVRGERQALKRFAAAMEAAERASPKPIAEYGAASMNRGRAIWSQAKLQPPRRLAHAWLLWGAPDRCETIAKTLKTRATLLGQAMAIDAPIVDAPAPKAQPDQPPPPAAPATIDSVLDGSQPPAPASTPPQDQAEPPKPTN